MLKTGKGEVTYHQNRIGRAGHALKDIFTAVILSEIFNLKLVVDQSWNNPILRHLPRYQSKATRHINFNISRQAWDGISKEEFGELAKVIREQRASDMQLVLSGVCRIHLWQVHLWEQEGDLEAGTFVNCIRRLESFYWANEVRPAIREMQIAIHVRRGDVASPGHREYFKMGPGLWSAEYYRGVVETLRNRYPGHEITLFSEVWQAEDLLSIPGVAIELGGAKQFSRHFRRMVTSAIFVPTSSSMSTWASYLSLGKVLIPEHPIKHFNHPVPLENWDRV